MNSSTPNIKRLIRLHLGDFSNGAIQAISQQLTNDSRWQKTSDKIRRAIRFLESKQPVENAEPNFQVSDEDLAEWLMDLNGEQVSELDERALGSDRLLMELVEAFLFERNFNRNSKHVPETATDPLDELNQARLYGLWPVPNDRLPAPLPSPPHTTPNHPVGSTDDTQLASKDGRAKPEGQVHWPVVWVVAAVVLGLIATGSIWYFLESINQKTPDLVEATDESTDPNDPAIVDNVPDSPDSRSGDPNTESLVDDSATKPATTSVPNQSPDPPTEKPEVAVVPSQDNEAADGRVDSAAPESSRSTVVAQLVVPRMTWDELKGVIAVHNKQTDEWAGLKSMPELNVNESLVTLPGSWGRAVLDDGPILVMDEDTSLGLRREVGETIRYNVNVDFGRFAIRRLPKGSLVHLAAGDAIWDWLVEEDDTTLGVDFTQTKPVAFQRSGASRISDEQLRGSGQGVANGNIVEWTRLELATNWVSSYQGEPFSDRDSRFMESDDLTKALETSFQSPSVSQEVAAFCLNAKLSSQPLLGYQMLSETTNPAQSAFVFQWMLRQMNTPRRPVVMRLLAAKTGDRASVMEVFQAFNRMRNGVPDEPRVRLVVAQLSSNEVFLRVAARQYLIEFGGGDPVAYNPHEPLETCRRKGAEWFTLLQNAGRQRRQ